MTTPVSTWLYTLIAGYLLGLLTAMLIMGLFIFGGSALLPPRTHAFFNLSPAQITPKMISLALVALLIVAGYITLIYTLATGLYLAATGVALIFTTSAEKRLWS